MRLFLDMDGVLVDFDSGYHKHFGVRPDKDADDVDWAKVRAVAGFYLNLEPMADALALWNGVADLGLVPTILTGIPKSITAAADEKRLWVRRWLGAHVEVITCRSKDKATHAKPGDVLVDDWTKHKHVWEAMGGIWITHTSAEASLDQLKRLLTK